MWSALLVIAHADTVDASEVKVTVVYRGHNGNDFTTKTDEIRKKKQVLLLMMLMIMIMM